MPQSPRTVVTTGANSGIGLATALALARRGFRSVGTVRSEEKAEAVRKAAARAKVRVETALLDVTDPEGCARVIEAWRPWGLVNNAGYGFTAAVEDADEEEARRLVETMVFAPVRLARLALGPMRAAGGGRIVNVSSIYGRTTTPLTGWYQAAKHALEALSDALRVEVASDGIRVIVIEPGGFRTGIWEDLQRDVEKRGGSRYATAYRRSMSGVRLWQPLMGKPEDAAGAIVRALTAWYPRPRYLVGADARLVALSDRLVPTGLKDWVSRRTLGI